MKKMITKKDIYGRKKILLPTPKFIVLYNGTEQRPERKKLRLSDSYMTETGEINLELIVLQLNINKDLNFKIKEQCQTLYEYTQYVELVRKYQQTESLEEAVEHAIDKCIEENILREFLEQNRREVTKLSIYEYNKELHEKSLLNEGIETGEQRKLKEIVYRMLDKNSTLETICDITGEPQSEIYELQKSYERKLREKDLS